MRWALPPPCVWAPARAFAMLELLVLLLLAEDEMAELRDPHVAALDVLQLLQAASVSTLAVILAQ